MILTHHGAGCIKAVAGDTTLVFGPIAKASKPFKPTNFGADVAFISFNHPDGNGAAEAARGDREPFIISSAGEYEVKEITAAGFASVTHHDEKERINTIYSVHFDGMTILYMGAHDGLALPQEVLEMDSPDILIIPVGGEGKLNPEEAHKLAVKLEAKIVIPTFYTDVSLQLFLKEAGAESSQIVDKLTIKPRDLAGKEGEVVVLSS